MNESLRPVGVNRNPVQRSQDLVKVSEMYRSGFTQAEIAEEIGVSRPQISYDLKSLHKQWLAAGLANIDEAKSQELARLDKVESDAWAEWESSRQPIKKLTREGDEFEQQRDGNPAFLDQVQKCIAQRRAILGLDAPKVTAQVNVDAMTAQQAFGHFWKEVEAWLLKDRRAVEALAEILVRNEEMAAQVALLVRSERDGDRDGASDGSEMAGGSAGAVGREGGDHGV